MIRIVKLTFQEDKVQDFLSFFDTVKHIVNNFPGCEGMQLLQDIHNPSIVMTYSHWKDENDLENYRVSNEFKNIWSTIKPWFAQKAEAWSVDAYFNGFELK
ncbi:MAG TPA: antibiotic biosynthesis monooxygenase family protein [Taishania sp.]|nr:antibiotic biosynthesis monooxygenase family protein [Taishania sp.]